MKRPSVIVLVSLLVIAGLLFGWLAGPDVSGLLPEAGVERSKGHGLDAKTSDRATGGSPSATREVVDVGFADFETRLLPADHAHISGIVLNASEEPVEGAVCRVLEGRAPAGLAMLLSNFYEATGSYHALRTCNVWTNSALRQAGLRTATWAPFEESVFRYFPEPE